MSDKVVLDKGTFKALASETRLGLLKNLDGKEINLSDLARSMRMNKATLLEHLDIMQESGLVSRVEREGHKFVYYKLTFKGSGILHPERTWVTVLLSAAIITFAVGMWSMGYFAADYAGTGAMRNIQAAGDYGQESYPNLESDAAFFDNGFDGYGGLIVSGSCNETETMDPSNMTFNATLAYTGKSVSIENGTNVTLPIFGVIAINQGNESASDMDSSAGESLVMESGPSLTMMYVSIGMLVGCVSLVIGASIVKKTKRIDLTAKSVKKKTTGR